MKNFSGTALFLNRADINTDEIIAAKYLTEISKEALGPHLFEDLNLDGFDVNNNISGKNDTNIIIKGTLRGRTCFIALVKYKGPQRFSCIDYGLKNVCKNRVDQ